MDATVEQNHETSGETLDVDVLTVGPEFRAWMRIIRLMGRVR